MQVSKIDPSRLNQALGAYNSLYSAYIEPYIFPVVITNMNMNEVADLAAILDDQSKADHFSDIVVFIDDMAYQGFDPRFLLTSLIRRGTDAKTERIGKRIQN